MEGSRSSLELKALFLAYEKKQQELEKTVQSLSDRAKFQSHDLGMLSGFVSLCFGEEFRKFQFDNRQFFESSLPKEVGQFGQFRASRPRPEAGIRAQPPAPKVSLPLNVTNGVTKKCPPLNVWYVKSQNREPPQTKPLNLEFKPNPKKENMTTGQKNFPTTEAFAIGNAPDMDMSTSDSSDSEFSETISNDSAERFSELNGKSRDMELGATAASCFIDSRKEVKAAMAARPIPSISNYQKEVAIKKEALDKNAFLSTLGCVPITQSQKPTMSSGNNQRLAVPPTNGLIPGTFPTTPVIKTETDEVRRVGRPKMSVDSRVREFVCTLCGNKYLSKAGLRNHERRIHYVYWETSLDNKTMNAVEQWLYHPTPNCPTYECSKCKKTFKGSQKMQSHKDKGICKKVNKFQERKKGFSYPATPVPISNSYSCRFCSKGFLREGNLQRHQDAWCLAAIQSRRQQGLLASENGIGGNNSLEID